MTRVGHNFGNCCKEWDQDQITVGRGEGGKIFCKWIFLTFFQKFLWGSLNLVNFFINSAQQYTKVLVSNPAKIKALVSLPAGRSNFEFDVISFLLDISWFKIKSFNEFPFQLGTPWMWCTSLGWRTQLTSTQKCDCHNSLFRTLYYTTALKTILQVMHHETYKKF